MGKIAKKVAQKKQVKVKLKAVKEEVVSQPSDDSQREEGIDEPKRPLTAYLRFCDALRRDARAKKMPLINMRDLGRAWRKLTDSEKKKYQDPADAAMKRYRKELEEYSKKNAD